MLKCSHLNIVRFITCWFEEKIELKKKEEIENIPFQITFSQ